MNLAPVNSAHGAPKGYGLKSKWSTSSEWSLENLYEFEFEIKLGCNSGMEEVD